MVKKSKTERIDPGFVKDLKGVMRTRAQKRLADPLRKEEMSIREATRLARTTDSWPGVLKEMSWKEKRRKLQ